MFLGILSDTHDQYDRTEKAVDDLVNRGVEAIVHCGDLASPRIIQIGSHLPFYFVFGKHDADVVPELEASAQEYNANCLGWGGKIDSDGKCIAVAHSHLTMDIQPLLGNNPDYLLTGHSHEPRNWLQGKTRRSMPWCIASSPTFYLCLTQLAIF